MDLLILRPRRFETGGRPQETDHEESRADQGETQIRLLDGQVVGSIKHDNDGDRSPPKKRNAAAIMSLPRVSDSLAGVSIR